MKHKLPEVLDPVTMSSYEVETIQSYGIDIKNRVIYVNSEDYGEYADGETGVDFIMAAKFAKNLDYLNSLSSEPILVKTLNCGGCWFYGMSMYDAIKESKAPVTVHAKAWARSMSSIIIQAGTKRILSKHAVFMVHYGEYGDYGDMRKVFSGMDFYKSLNRTMFDIYAARCIEAKHPDAWTGLTVEEISKAIEDKVKEKTDWWLTAEEALFFGFIDEIV